MALSPEDILNITSRDFILGNTTVEEQIDFITYQIKDPFGSGNSNFFKKIRSMVKNPDKLDAICVQLLGNIEDVYPNLEFDLSETDQHLDTTFNAIYKFFIRNISKHMLNFLQQYILSGKNRKALIADYLNAKLPNYPKEQYGKKEYYILVTKLSSIVDDIFEDSDVNLEKFISYLERSGRSPMYFGTIKELLDQGTIIDHDALSDIYDQFKESEEYNKTMCKLQVMITQDLINPYLEENGLSELKVPAVDPIEEDTDDDDDSNNEEE